MFQKHRYLMFPSKSIHTDGIRAGVMVGASDVGGHVQLIISSNSLPLVLVKSAAQLLSSIHATFSALSNRLSMQITNPGMQPALDKPINQ
jgi:hypothetical protein